ncbi:membrane-spanning 4-domains subfamily A member 4D-like [Girardinichthys multiradiatus]|uniref:membrane-spanning 4-domains subfamily A member 4D-like n=1 Tax=Girardinichthys multiradiatus TaxID=208333 RepID=UPI001FAB700A|nr:membrane-spanning 4-domains subfamily A member 4D-like [Girardinichthys multiradiatus]XP_047209781.1 membrane-spanning 4-domains subfamily A member 4D-like [Girardinichthys multiradiatus]
MEQTVSTAVDRTTVADENQKTENILMSSKPLHRFVQKQPRSLGIVILMFGCAEVLMGIVLASDRMKSSFMLYIPFWQGSLFLTCGVLTIYTELHPSKKMVTICLAMYVVSLLGLIDSIGYRIYLFLVYSHPYIMISRDDYVNRDDVYIHIVQVACVEGILFASSLCVFAFLIFLSIIASFAIKSTHTHQIIVQHIVMHPQREATSN